MFLDHRFLPFHGVDALAKRRMANSPNVRLEQMQRVTGNGRQKPSLHHKAGKFREAAAWERGKRGSSCYLDWQIIFQTTLRIAGHIIDPTG